MSARLSTIASYQIVCLTYMYFVLENIASQSTSFALGFCSFQVGVGWGKVIGGNCTYALVSFLIFKPF